MSSNAVTGNETVTRGSAGKKTVKRVNVRYMTMTAMLSAVAFVLMFLDFSVPLMPTFIKMDLSELPALIGSFAMGPVYGVVVCLIKNLLHLLMTSTGGVGELSNFILGAAFVLPAGIFYQRKRNKKSAFTGALVGAVCMAVIGIFSNTFLVYPIYYNIMPQEAIISAYQSAASILPIEFTWDTMMPYLVAFNMPFTFIKGMVTVIVTFLIYKHISPLIKGVNRNK